MTFKGTVGKFETLADGSIKLAVFLPKEMKDEAVKLSYETVYVSQAPESEQDVGESLRILGQQAERIADVTEGIKRFAEELAEKYGLNITSEPREGGQEALTLDDSTTDASDGDSGDSRPISQDVTICNKCLEPIVDGICPICKIAWEEGI